MSGCTRECAEAQSKDFGLIATSKGYNVYVGGNGGARPVHAQLLASDVDETTATLYLDRYLAYYIKTADRLQRTAPWLQQLEGGIEQLKRVVIEDALGICAELEKHMARLLDTYQCEWTTVIKDPKKREAFKQFRELGQDAARHRVHPTTRPDQACGLAQGQGRAAQDRPGQVLQDCTVSHDSHELGRGDERGGRRRVCMDLGVFYHRGQTCIWGECDPRQFATSLV